MSESAFYDLLYHVYITGNLDEIRKGLVVVHPNFHNEVDDMQVFIDGIMERLLAENPYFEDDLGVFQHYLEGGTMITLAMSRHHSRASSIIELLMEYGAQANDLPNLPRALAYGQEEVVKLLVEHGAVVTPEHVKFGFRVAPVEVLRYFYDVVGIRMSRGELDELIEYLRVRGGGIDPQFHQLAERFARRTPSINAYSN